MRADTLTVLVVGGGRVGARKARAFLDAGACVRVVAPDVADDLQREQRPSLTLARRSFAESDLDGVDLAVAATGDTDVNTKVATLCRERRVLCNRADDPASGTFETLAVHRSGPLAIGVSAGGVPGAAARIRDELACRFDDRYAAALHRLAQLRKTLRREEAWRTAAASLTGTDFCSSVENGALMQRISEWD